MHNLPEKLPAAVTRELVIKAQAGSVAARNAAITGNMRLVAAIAEGAARAVGRQDLVDDLIMAGAMGVAPGDGLLHAVMHFDSARGVQFATYAHPFIREAVSKQLASLSRDLGTYKTHERRTTIRNRAKRLATTLGRAATAPEVHAALSPSMKRGCSLAAVELALAPAGRESCIEPGDDSHEDDTIARIDRRRQLDEVRNAAEFLLDDAARALLTRRYGGETLRGAERKAADAAEAELRDFMTAG